MSVYTRQYTNDVGWENEPSTATPINATNLNKMDDAIGAIDAATYNAFASVEESIGGVESDVSDVNESIGNITETIEQINDTLETVDEYISHTDVTHKIRCVDAYKNSASTITDVFTVGYLIDNQNLSREDDLTDNNVILFVMNDELTFDTTSDGWKAIWYKRSDDGNVTTHTTSIYVRDASGSLQEYVEGALHKNHTYIMQVDGSKFILLGVLNNDGVPIATNNTAGIVKPDGSTITVANDGTLTSHGGGVSTLSALTDTAITSPTAGQPLTYDDTSGKWVNGGVIPTANGGTGNNSGYIRIGQALVEHEAGNCSTSEGVLNDASGDYAHAEGANVVAGGDYSHAEGQATRANGDYSHAGGRGTVAEYDYQTVIGKYNDNKSTTLFEIGNGENLDESNAFEVHDNGNVVAGGNISGASISVPVNPSATMPEGAIWIETE